MDLAKILLQLHEELAHLDAAILTLERLQEGGKRRGRPPAWLAHTQKPDRTPRKHRVQAEPQSAARK